jgi:hypothetical protein
MLLQKVIIIRISLYKIILLATQKENKSLINYFFKTENNLEKVKGFKITSSFFIPIESIIFFILFNEYIF